MANPHAPDLGAVQSTDRQDRLASRSLSTGRPAAAPDAQADSEPPAGLPKRPPTQRHRDQAEQPQEVTGRTSRHDSSRANSANEARGFYGSTRASGSGDREGPSLRPARLDRPRVA